MKRLGCVLLLLLAGAVRLAAGEEDTHAGWIQSIDANCDGKWKANEKSEEQALHPDRDHYRFLYAGESLRCAGSGTMKLQIYDFPLQTITKDFGPCTVEADALVCKPEIGGARRIGRESVRQSSIRVSDRKALQAFGRPAGRRRGLPTPLYSPAEDSVVQPNQVVFRWNAPVKSDSVELQLLDKYNGRLWEEKQVPGSAGQFLSVEARQILVRFRDERGTGPITIILAAGEADPPEVHFSLLSTAEEVALEAELRACDPQSDLRRAVCRTYAFTRRKMWNEAADEHEAALRLAPRSQDLILATIVAHKNTGNTKRVAELVEELPPGTKVPD